MFTKKEIMDMTPQEFMVNWRKESIQDATLKLLGEKPMTPEDEEYLKTHE